MTRPRFNRILLKLSGEALMGQGQLGIDPDDLARTVPTRQVGDPADFGAVVAFLCSEHARFVTGIAVPVDGGQFLGLQ